MLILALALTRRLPLAPALRMFIIPQPEPAAKFRPPSLRRYTVFCPP